MAPTRVNEHAHVAHGDVARQEYKPDARPVVRKPEVIECLCSDVVSATGTDTEPLLARDTSRASDSKRFRLYSRAPVASAFARRPRFAFARDPPLGRNAREASAFVRL
ncbi:hypothetical protein CCR75_009314 [Bremia lactucae]|uniref:Uncharacterized protein n=1 Tax=Bremia lactucae TaxID=4779 RepID=A0A976IMH4_BRELC|nr:hypothetical protein CCR75_009314 [Bremia lactucae]